MILLTVKEASQQLKVSPATVYQLCAEGKLPHVRIGTRRGTIRINETDLHAFLDACRTEQSNQAIGPLKHICLGR